MFFLSGSERSYRSLGVQADTWDAYSTARLLKGIALADTWEADWTARL